MTKHRDFKALVRERMQKTGERYTAARAQLAGKSPVPSFSPQTLPGLLTGYDTFGGIQSGTAAVRNTLASMGHVSPFDGAPYKESWINGLCGGPGFLYAVFDTKAGRQCCRWRSAAARCPMSISRRASLVSG